MAACESLEKPAFLETLSSWKPVNQDDAAGKSPSFTENEILRDLHFRRQDLEPPSMFPPLPVIVDSDDCSGVKDKEVPENFPKNPASQSGTPKSDYAVSHGKNDSFSSMNSDSLQLCTEGLGFESCGDLEDLRIETDDNCRFREERKRRRCEFRRSRSMGAAGFPPPIPSISTSGKPWVCFKSYRQGGRFVLKEIRIPTVELLQSSREGGRLRLRFVQPRGGVVEDEAGDVEEAEEVRGATEDRERGDGEEDGDS